MAVSVPTWWSRPSPRAAYALAAAIGLGSVIAIYGPGFVFGTSDYWRMPALVDHRMYMMGYRYFLHEPCGWPLFDAPTAMPHMRSIAFSDTPLLWAALHKAIATVIPPWRDYSAQAFLGLWYAVTGTLQAVFGVACLRALGHKSLRVAIVGSLFFVAIPAWTFRFPHASLHAHFLVLWALYLYLARASRRAQLIQLAVAALLNPYHTVMSLAVFAASLARSPGRIAIAWLVAGCAVVALALAIAGYFAGEAATAVSGFSASGANLLGPLMPLDSGWFGTRAWSDVTGLQYEGICYLGAGLLALAPFVRRVRASVRRHLPLAIVAAATAVFALSNHLYLGSHRVLAYPIPHALHWIPDQFRCPGRFAWLPMYVGVIFVLAHGFARFATGWKRLLMPALAIVQLVDVSPDWIRLRNATAAPATTPLDITTWRTLLASVDEVDVVPAHDCNSDRSFELATQIEYLASESATPINGIYTARPLRDCDTDTARAADFHPQPRTLYVFVAPMIALAKRLAAAGVPCAEFAAGEVCTRDRALIDSLGWPATPPPAPLADAIDLADPAATYLELGWASAEPDGRWTDGPVARLVFRPPPARDVNLRIEASAMLCGTRVTQSLDIALDGEPLGTLQFTPASNEMTPARTLHVRSELLAHPIVELELRPRDFRPGRDVGCRHGRRELAVKVRRVWLEAHSSVSP